MIDGSLFDKLEEIGRIIRGDKRPFGGLQMIISGDFFQLPPIGPLAPDGTHREPTMAFDAQSWSRVIPDINRFELSKVYRQADSTFVRLLNRLRKGLVDDEDVERLVACNRPLNFKDGIEATQLFNTNAKVRNHNNARLAELPGPLHTFEAQDIPGRDSQGRGLSPGEATELLDRRTTWPQELNLRVGAQVMLLTIFLSYCGPVTQQVLVGIVEDLITESERKAQGIPLASCCGWFPRPPTIKFPVVRFVRIRGSKPPPERVMVAFAQKEIRNANHETHAIRKQVPLSLAWYVSPAIPAGSTIADGTRRAWTVHKSQGQTLERVKIDLSSTFAEGDTSVVAFEAQARLNVEQDRHILPFPAQVMVSQRVQTWYDQLARSKVKAEVNEVKEERL
ncbi:hypothetical protein JCM24511_01360 [Saitozyma sp. JCM 24511]|nr:hypothetical protein JCM24511_01360 [Saitozyma sp. JCM 24511]